MTTVAENDAIRAHARRWAELGPELDRLRQQTLLTASEEELRQMTLDVLAGPLEWFLDGSKPRSGLEEQQRIFKICRH